MQDEGMKEANAPVFLSSTSHLGIEPYVIANLGACLSLPQDFDRDYNLAKYRAPYGHRYR